MTISIQSGHPRDVANRICAARDGDAVAGMLECALNGTRFEISQAISIIGELGNRCPDLLIPHVAFLTNLARTGTGRVVWESATALAGIARTNPDMLKLHIDTLEHLARGTSVIARDRAVEALCAIGTINYEQVWPILIATIRTAPVNQFPTYVERMAPGVRQSDIPALVDIIQSRMSEMPNPAKRRRLYSILKRLA